MITCNKLKSYFYQETKISLYNLQKKPKPTTTTPIQKQTSNNNPPSQDGNNLVEALIKHDQHLDEKLQGLEIKNDEAQEKMSKLEQELEELKRKSKNYDEQIASLEKKTCEASDNATTREIQKYLAIYERLKSDEKLFKVIFSISIKICIKICHPFMVLTLSLFYDDHEFIDFL
jgi:predicted RNase H-like nuclease (RuvC/YqgF family)